jgi:dihydrofolate reductase
MRKLTGAVFVSLDGVMQAPGGPEEDPTGEFRFGGWVQPFWSEDMGPFEDIIMGEYDLLLAKRTYDIFSAYWPFNQDDAIGAKFQHINKYVLTHSDEHLSWDNSHKLSGETAAAVAELKGSEGRDLLIQGSSTLYPPLLAAGLIDRLVLITFPVLLGEGKSIFDGAQGSGALKLVEHFVSEKGVVLRPTSQQAKFRPDRSRRRSRAKPNLSGATRWKPVPGSARSLRPPLFVLHLEGVDRALRERNRVRVPRDRPDCAEVRELYRQGTPIGPVPGADRRRCGDCRNQLDR